MFVLALLGTQAPAALSLAEIEQLSPAAAGRAILRDREHGPVETVEPPANGMPVPGIVERELVERPIVTASGCSRKRWTVSFRTATGKDPGTAMVENVRSRDEIAPLSDGQCPTGRYIGLNSHTRVDQGWQALADLKAVSATGSHARFQCTDRTASGLCDNDRTIRSSLRALSPWMVTSDKGDVLIWLGTPGSTLTEVRYNPAAASDITVNRRIPAPF